MSKTCWRHDFTNWSDPIEAQDIYWDGFGHAHPYDVVIQIRRCKECHFMDSRKIVNCKMKKIIDVNEIKG